MADIPVLGFRKYWSQKLASLKSECHVIANKYTEAASVVQQVYKVLSDIENLARCTLAEVGESSGWASIVNNAEENREKYYKALDEKQLFSILYGMYTVTLNELKDVLKVSAQAGQSGDQNHRGNNGQDFQEVKRRKRHISNNTSQTAKKYTKPVPTFAADKLPPKAVLTRNFFTPLRITDKDIQTIGAENKQLEQEAPRKSGRPPPIMMNSTTKLIQLQSDLKDHVEGK
jgi:hypothetical protein